MKRIQTINSYFISMKIYIKIKLPEYQKVDNLLDVLSKNLDNELNKDKKCILKQKYENESDFPLNATFFCSIIEL